MGTDAAPYRGFSCPLEPLDDAVLNWVLRGYVSCLLDLFLDRFTVLLRSCGHGVVEQLATLRDDSLPYCAIWSPALGGILQALQTNSSPAAQNAAATLLMQVGSTGHPGSWWVRFPGPVTLRWGHWLYSACERIEVCSTGSRADIKASCSGRVRHDRLHHAGLGTGWTGAGPDALRFVGTDHGSVVVLPSRALSWTPFGQLKLPVREEIGQSDYGALVDCFRETNIFSPRYYEWVAKIVRGVVLVESPQSKLYSASQDECCGVVYLSNNHDPLLVGEMLVHEASHQYYFIATRHGPAVDPSDDRQFYSPFVLQLRSLDRILLGFHAFANVYLYYESALKSGLERRTFCEEQMAKVRHDLEIVVPLIRDTDKLTDLGRELAQPLLDALDVV